MAAPYLIGDIGGTNARFALAVDGAIQGFAALRVAEHADIASAVRSYLAGQPSVAGMHGVSLAVAGPVAHNSSRMTNSDWLIAPESFAGLVPGPVRLLNDLEAVAWSLPALRDDDTLALRPGEAEAGRPMLVIAPGTGLGMSALIRGPHGRYAAIASEGGHASFAPEDVQEDALLQHLRRQHGHVSAERLLSGPGLEAIYAAMAALAGEGDGFKPAPEITAGALAGTCARSVASMHMFCALLGSFTGNMALAFGAHGGVYIGGGIVPRIADFMRHSAFSARFAAKGRSSAFLQDIPIRLIKRPDAAMLGLIAYTMQIPEGEPG